MNRKLLEPIGLILILVSIFWRVFLADEIKAIKEGVWKLRVEEKIDLMFMLLSTHFRKDHPKSSERSQSFNLDGVEDRWELAGGERHRVDKQSRWLTKIQEILFILGSTLVVVSKF